MKHNCHQTKRKMSYVFLTALVVFSMLFSVFIPAFAGSNTQKGNDVWDGKTSTEIKKGSGTKEDPFLVETGANLYYLVQNATSGYFKITNDIYLNDVSDEEWENKLTNKWTLKWSNFKGTLDGDGHTIYGLYNDAAADRMGLFTALQAGATVKSLKISRSRLNNMSANKYAGAVCGMVYGYATFKNCAVDETVSVNSAYAGGIAGAVSLNGEMKFESCYSTAKLSGTKTAGFVANSWNGGSKEKIVINSSYCVNGFFVSKNDGINTYVSNAYSTSGASVTTNPRGINGTVALITTENIKGENAAVNMPGLDWKNTFKTTVLYPDLTFASAIVDPTNYWDGIVSNNYSSGSGTSEDPYLITNVSDLALLVKTSVENGADTLNKYYKITENITVNKIIDSDATQWYTKAGGLSGKGFAGHLDGNGHTISGLYVLNTTDNSYAGLFPMIVSGASVKNIGIINSSFSGKFVGGICGGIIKDNTESAVIDSCFLDDTVKISASDTSGGIIGRTFAALTILNSYTTSNVEAVTKAGGILGDKWSKDTVLTIKGCYTTNKKLFAQGQNISDDSLNNYSSENLNLEQMKGIAAKSNMPGLDWKNTYCLTTGFPALKIFPNDDIVSDYDGGSGTKEDPYRISTGEQLKALANEIKQPANSTAGKYYTLTADIKLNDTSNPNWKENANEWPTQEGFNGRFKGFFEGNGHIISGLYAVSDNTAGRAGLFTCADGGAVIRNVHIRNSFISGKGYAGGIVGYINGTTGEEIKIEGCSVDETVEIKGGHAGGVVGGTSGNTTLKYCYSTASISTGTGGHISALLGNSWTGNNKLIQCYFVGTKGYRFVPDTLDYVYGTVAVKNGDGIVILTPEQMKGNSAKQYMPELDWNNIWQISENGYPTLKVVPYIEEVPFDGEPGTVWTGKVALNFAGGTGTKEDPYQIATGEQLAKLVETGMRVKNDTQGKYYVITNDIILNDVSKSDWIGSAKTWYTQNGRNDYFKGTLDGRGHTVKGIYQKATPLESVTSTYAGLIPVIGAGATVRNIRIENSSIASKGYAGAVVGYAQVAENDKRQASVIGCTVASSVTVTGWTAGGIVGGSPENLNVVACGFVGKLSSSAKGYRSGIVGNTWNAHHTIYNCYSIGYHTYRNDAKKPNKIQNVYGTVSQTGVITVSADKMFGNNAKKFMPKLDWSIWKTVTDGYPVIGNLPDDYTGITTYEGITGNVWSGKLATKFAGGTGTKSDPYLISTPEQLAFLVDKSISEQGATKGKYYKLTHDIKLNDVSKSDWKSKLPNDWYYSSDSSKAFEGHFDGNGHVVFGIYVNETLSSTSFAGLFPVVAYGSVVEKVGISQVFISMKSVDGDKKVRGYVGGIAGYVQVTPKNNADGTDYVKIIQCFGDTTVELSGSFAGGMVCGCPSPVKIENCYFVGALNASLNYSGGMIGNIWVKGASITKSYSHTRNLDPIANNQGSNVTMINTYCTGKNFGDGKKTSHYKIYSEEAAKTLVGFDFKNIWKTVKNGTPVLRVFGSDVYSNRSTPEKIKVSFSTNSEQEIAPIYGNAGTKLVLPVPEEREGYAFDGWYVYKELDVKYAYDIFPSYDITLYAKWISLSVEQNFESYPNTEWDRTDGFEYFKPGVMGYSPRKVHDGSKSMHLKADNSGKETFLVFNDKKLEVGKKYKITYWVLSDSNNSKGDLNLIHSKNPDIWEEKIGYEKIASLNELQSNNWTQLSYTFTANGEYIMIEAVDSDSIYFDSVKVTLLNENGEIGNLKQLSGNVNSQKTEKNANKNTVLVCVVSLGVLVAICGALCAVIFIKKKAKKR
ncbi:MAG TPA: hypothetical protein DDY61_07565 [Ruminococcaceae bacterium]|nr:hypothetical protein [Oscillospiraceae bacterium]